MYVVYPLLAAGGPVTFVATKVTKKAVTRNASLRSWPLLCKAARTTGCNYFAPLRSLISLRFSKNLLCPCNRTAHHRSARFHPKLICWGGEKFSNSL